MSAAPLALEDFGRLNGLVPLSTVDGERLEAEKLSAFDKGYTAGWDDALEANAADAENAERVLAARMEDLGFTFHEARAHVMASLKPLLSGIVASVVPQVLHDTLGHRLDAAIQELADGQPDPEITFLVPLGGTADLEKCLAEHARFPTRIEEDDSLQAGFIQMRMGTVAREIDLNLIEKTLTDALDALNSLTEETLSHG